METNGTADQADTLDEAFERGEHGRKRGKQRAMRHRRGEGPSTSFAIRLTADELDILQAAAEARGVTLSEFVRSSSLRAARGRRGKGEDNRESLGVLRDQALALAATIEKIVGDSSERRKTIRARRGLDAQSTPSGERGRHRSRRE